MAYWNKGCSRKEKSKCINTGKQYFACCCSCH
jgi:hypothetical protein